MPVFKFTVDLKGGKSGYCYFNADNFGSAQERVGRMITDLVKKGCSLINSNLRVVEKERAKCR